MMLLIWPFISVNSCWKYMLKVTLLYFSLSTAGYLIHPVAFIQSVYLFIYLYMYLALPFCLLLSSTFSTCSELPVPQMTQPWILLLTEHARTHSITYIIYVKTSIQLNGPPSIYHLVMTLPESTIQSHILLIEITF